MSKAKQREPGKIVGHEDRQLLGDAATRAYVDHHVQLLQTGVLKRSVVDIVNSPPSGIAAGMYIVGKNPTGAFATWANKVVLHIPGFGGAPATWTSIEPADKEERLVESRGKIFQYQAATKEWVEFATATTTPSTGGREWFEADHVFHKVVNLPAGWKRCVIDGQGLIHTATNNAVAKVTFVGTVPALNSIISRAAFWGFSHNDYQYAEATWWTANMIEGTAFKCNYPIGGHTYGAGSIYRWRVEATANYTTGYVSVQTDVNGQRSTSSHYLCHYITLAQLKLQPASLTALDLGFNGQEIDMSGTVEIVT